MLDNDDMVHDNDESEKNKIRSKDATGAPGLTTRNKRLLGAPGIATRSKGRC